MPGHSEPLVAVSGLRFASFAVIATAGHGLGFFENLKEPFVSKPDEPLLGSILSGILAELRTYAVGRRCLIESLMKQVLVILLRRSLDQEVDRTPLYQTIANPRLAQVINTIQDDHAERLSIPGLAQKVGMTPLGLTREFEAVFGQSLLDYILTVRLHHASALLKHTALPIKSIAASVGYASRSHFSRAFTKHRGADPTTFRRASAVV